MPLTDRVSVVADAIYDVLVANQVALGIVNVYYGDQEKIPQTPSVAVEAAPLNRELTGIGGKGRTDNNFTVVLLVYVARLLNSQQTKREAETLAEDIADVLHSDVTMGGNVVHGYVSAIEPGYATRSGQLMHAVRMTWTGMSKTGIT